MCDCEGGLWFVVVDGGVVYFGLGWDGFSCMIYVLDDLISFVIIVVEVV